MFVSKIFDIKYIHKNVSGVIYMGGRASKNKGKSWERDICKFLGNTLGGSFIRVPNSGAFIGGSNASRKVMLSDGQVRQAKGDIVPPDELIKLNIEAKTIRKSLSTKSLMEIAFN